MLVLCLVCKTDVYVVEFLQFEGAVVREQVLLVYVFTYWLCMEAVCCLFCVFGLASFILKFTLYQIKDLLK